MNEYDQQSVDRHNKILFSRSPVDRNQFIRSTVIWSTQSTLGLKNAYDNNIQLPCTNNIEFWMARHNVTLFSTKVNVINTFTVVKLIWHCKLLIAELIILIKWLLVMTIDQDRCDRQSIIKNKSCLCQSTGCQSLRSITTDSIDGCSAEQEMTDQFC